MLRVYGRPKRGMHLPLRARGAVLRMRRDPGQGSTREGTQLSGKYVSDLSQAHKEHSALILPMMWAQVYFLALQPDNSRAAA